MTFKVYYKNVTSNEDAWTYFSQYKNIETALERIEEDKEDWRTIGLTYKYKIVEIIEKEVKVI